MAIDKDKMMRQVSAMIDEAVAADKPAPKPVIGNRIGLRNFVTRVMSAAGRNASLRALCESYIDAIDAGQADELLYESFISNASNYSYLNAVDTELSALNERIKKYKQDIDLTKILRLMEQTTSYYIVPLIEESVAAYVNDKTPANRVMLRSALTAFQGDPYVKEINNILNLDNSIPNNVYLGESFDAANSAAKAETVCSPVQYIKENESVFNVRGNYYVRKGNTVSKLPKSDISSLPADFRALCEAVNSPMVSFDMNKLCAEVSDAAGYVTITTDGKVFADGKILTESEWNAARDASYMMNEGRDAFWRTAQIIKDNIADNIAVLDFVKHVGLNESGAGRSVDVFRLKDNIYVTTVDESMGKTTFYRNVNPLQAKNLINNHMNLNISALFEDVLPNQDKIKKEVDDTCKEYESYIQELTEKKDTLCAMKESDGDDGGELAEAIKLVEDEIEKVKNDYKDYQDSVKDVTGEPSDKDVDSVDPDGADDGGDDVAVKDVEPDGGADDPTEPLTDDGAEDIPDFDGVLDIPAGASSDGADRDPYGDDYGFGGVIGAAADGTKQDDGGFEIVKVAYNTNVKTGEVSNKGEVHIIIPSVNSNGELVQDVKKVTFYLTSDKKPIINNDYMPLDMYNAIVDAVNACPDTERALAGDLDAAGGETPAVPADASAAGDSDILTADVLIDAPDTLALGISDDDDADGDTIETPAGTTVADSPIDDLDLSADVEDADDGGEDDITSLFNDLDSVPDDNPNEAETYGRTYPIEVKLDLANKYVSSLSPNLICSMLDDKGISYTRDGGKRLTISVKSKAEIYALKDFFKEWLDWTDDNFFNFFKEFSVAESLVIKGVDFINESVVKSGSRRSGRHLNERWTDHMGESVDVMLPYDAELVDDLNNADVHVFDEDDGFFDPDDFDEKMIQVSVDTVQEAERAADVIKAHDLADYSDEVASFVEDADNDLFHDILDDENDDPDNRGGYDRSADINFTLPYDEDLINELDAYEISYEEETDENGDDIIRVFVDGDATDDKTNLADILMSAGYDTETPEIQDFVETFYKNADEAYEGRGSRRAGRVDEGVRITVRDDSTGKTVEINTDDLNDGDNADAVKDNSDDTTFDTDDSDLFGKDDGDSDDSDDDGDASGDNGGEKNESADVPAPKKTFKFRPKAKLHESNVIRVNESADPNVLDYVTYKGERGQVISTYPDGDLVVNIKGSTVKCAPSAVRLVSEKKDTVKPAFKFDKATLKGIYESMTLRCGLFMNGVQLTPADCYVNYGEYRDAKDGDDVRIILEGEKMSAQKQYIRLLEDAAVNEDKYISGVETTQDGKALRNVWIDGEQYAAAENPSDLVDVILQDGTGTMTKLPKDSLKTLSV